MRRQRQSTRSFAATASEVGSRRGSWQSSRRGQGRKSLASERSGSTLSRGTSSAAHSRMSRMKSNRGDEFGASADARQGELRRRFEADQERLRMMQDKLLEMEQLLAEMRHKHRETVEEHDDATCRFDQRKAELEESVAQLEQGRVVKEAVLNDNHVYLSEVAKVVSQDRVKMAWNFIAKQYGESLEGIRPEEVFTPEYLAKFAVNRQRHNRALEIEIRFRTKRVAPIAALVLVSVILHGIMCTRARVDWKDIFTSVGMQGNQWFQEEDVEAQIQKPAAKPPTPPPMPVLKPERPRIEHHHAWRYRLRTQTEELALKARAKRCPELLTALSELEELQAADTVARMRHETKAERRYRLKLERDKAFQRARAASRSPSPDPNFYRHLPPAIARKPSMVELVRPLPFYG